jgi:hypothetical protein
MSRKRVRWLVAVLLLFAIALTALWWFYLRPPYGITKRSFARIQKGMTIAEVEEIIGSPPNIISSLVSWAPPRLDRTTLRSWHGPEHQISLVVDGNGIVLGKVWDGPESSGFLARILEWLGL